MKQKEKRTKEKSILYRILAPMCILLLVQAVIIAACVSAGGVMEQMSRNTRELFSQKVLRRGNVMQGKMSQWSMLDGIAGYVNACADQTGGDTAGQWDSAAENAFLESVAGQLTFYLRGSDVTGIFVVMNHEPLAEPFADKQGLYLRKNGRHRHQDQNNDITILRGPESLVGVMGYTKAESWTDCFSFARRQAYYDFLTYPYSEAVIDRPEDPDMMDLGYWSGGYTLSGDSAEAISYSVPLRAANGRVYGVLGVEITRDRLEVLLPYTEISDQDDGAYFLGISQNMPNTYDVAMSFSKDGSQTSPVALAEKKDGLYSAHGGDMYYDVESVDCYGAGSPFAYRQWVVLGAVPESDLSLVTGRVQGVLWLAGILVLAAGVLGAVIMSLLLGAPVKKLSQQLDQHQGGKDEKLHKTNITEIDRLIRSIDDLDRRVETFGTHYARIMEHSSVLGGGFDYNPENGDFFLTDNFFRIFGKPEISTQGMTLRQFEKEMHKLDGFMKLQGPGRYWYTFPGDQGERYVQITVSRPETCRVVGMAEDMTAQRELQRRIQYDKDHDGLTELWNRRAAIRKVSHLLDKHTDELKISALLMVDIDDLKNINEKYGHLAGDATIKRAAGVLQANKPESCILARISGDEFLLFFRGYESEEAVRLRLEMLWKAFGDARVDYDADTSWPVTVSGGVAFYPENGKTLEELRGCADFALYRAKQGRKGAFVRFNREDYEKDAEKKALKKELGTLLAEERVLYFFQPIVSTADGSVFAYEALMRSQMPNLRNPELIIRLAREAGKLESVETMTMFGAMKGYAENVREGYIHRDAYVFINSLSGQMMARDREEEFQQTYQEYTSRIVLEVTEQEQVNMEYLGHKRKLIDTFGGQMALDDYGSGYNGDNMLLKLAPEFVKVDMEIIRDIDKSADKQEIVRNLVAYAHERSMSVIAEGVETEAELRKVMELKVDLLQGYFLAKPQRNPAPIPEDVTELIRSIDI